MAGGTFIKIAAGAGGAAAANVDHITREQAVKDREEGVLLQNMPEEVEQARGQGRYRELRGELHAYAEMRQDVERARHGNRRGQARTHYRAVVSFEREIDTARALEMTRQLLDETMPEARAVAAVHRNTDDTHVHVWIDARQTNGKKLHISKRDFQELHEAWNRIYSREMGRDEQEHLQKLEQACRYKRERAAGREAARPDRTDTPLHTHHQETHRHDAYDETRPRRSQRSAPGPDQAARETQRGDPGRGQAPGRRRDRRERRGAHHEAARGDHLGQPGDRRGRGEAEPDRPGRLRADDQERHARSPGALASRRGGEASGLAQHRADGRHVDSGGGFDLLSAAGAASGLVDDRAPAAGRVARSDAAPSDRGDGPAGAEGAQRPAGVPLAEVEEEP